MQSTINIGPPGFLHNESNSVTHTMAPPQPVRLSSVEKCQLDSGSGKSLHFELAICFKTRARWRKAEIFNTTESRSEMMKIKMKMMMILMMIMMILVGW